MIDVIAARLPFRVVLGTVALLTAPPARSQERALPAWQQQSVAVAPLARHSHAMAWDAGRERVVLFGGRNGITSLGSTWEFDGLQWIQRAPAHSPAPRFDAGMAYDRLRQRIVLFGGAAITDLADTWEWDGNDWTQVVTAHAPSPRRLHTMVFDEARGVTVVFGGTLGAPGTWTYDGVDWTLHAVPDPGSREGAAAVYSPYSHRVLLFGGNLGGQLRNDLWQWNGTAWTALPQSGPPTANVYHVMAYDRSLGGFLLFGGITNQAWFWNGAWQPMASAPPGRSSAAMVHMDTYGRTVLFGGARAVLPYPTVLELDDLWRTTFVADQLPYGSGCGSPPLTLSPSTTAPRLGATWQPTIGNVPPVPGIALVAIGLSRSSFGGAPLPQSLTPLGWNGCDLLQDLAFAVGLFATPAGAGTASLAVPIPPLPQMAGYRLYAQAWAPSPGANPAGFIVSGGLSVVIGD